MEQDTDKIKSAEHWIEWLGSRIELNSHEKHYIILCMKEHAAQFQFNKISEPRQFKTLQECKDEVAREYGYRDWNHIAKKLSVDEVINTLCKNYASQFKQVERPQEISYTDYLVAIDAEDNNTYARKIYERLQHNGFKITHRLWTEY